MKLKYIGHYTIPGRQIGDVKDLTAEQIVSIHVSDVASGHEDPHRELAARCDALERLIGKLMGRLPESEWLEIAPLYHWVKP